MADLAQQADRLVAEVGTAIEGGTGNAARLNQATQLLSKLAGEIRRLLEHGDAVLRIHQAVEINYRDFRCTHCVAWDEGGKEFGQYNVPWPCPTVLALNVTRDEEDTATK